jgi:hypothetical protein
MVRAWSELCQGALVDEPLEALLTKLFVIGGVLVR